MSTTRRGSHQVLNRVVARSLQQKGIAATMAKSANNVGLGGDNDDGVVAPVDPKDTVVETQDEVCVDRRSDPTVIGSNRASGEVGGAPSLRSTSTPAGKGPSLSFLDGILKKDTKRPDKPTAAFQLSSSRASQQLREEGLRRSPQQHHAITAATVRSRTSSHSSQVTRDSTSKSLDRMLAMANDGNKDKRTPSTSSSVETREVELHRHEAVALEQLTSLKQEIQLAAKLSDWSTAMQLVCSRRMVGNTSPSAGGREGAWAAEGTVAGGSPEAWELFKARCECVGITADVCAQEEEEECVAWLLSHPALALQDVRVTARTTSPTLPRKWKEEKRSASKEDEASPVSIKRGVSATQFLRLAAAAEAVGANEAVLTLFRTQYLTEGNRFLPPKSSTAAAMAACDRLNSWERALQLLNEVIVRSAQVTSASKKPVVAAPVETSSANDEVVGEDNKTCATSPNPERLPDVIGGEAYAVALTLLDRNGQGQQSKDLLLRMPAKDQKMLAKAYTALISAWGATRGVSG